MELLLGLDVGTTATKASLFDTQGRIVAATSHPNHLITPRPGWVEQDPEALWQGVLSATRAVVGQAGPGAHILAVSQSSQGGTVIPIDAGGRPVYNAISWMDGRAGEECEAVRRTVGETAVYLKSGWMLDTALPLHHIAWLRTHCPDEFARTRRFLFVNDFIGLRLTGRLCMDPSNAGITQLLNVATCDWDDDLLALAGIRRDQLSPLQPSGQIAGYLTAKVAAASGLPAGIPLINGAHDQYCAAVGLGIVRPGRTLLSCGTAWVILAVPPSLEAGLSSGMGISPHAVAGLWGGLLSLGGVGASLEWLVDNVWPPATVDGVPAPRYAVVDEAARRSPAGASGLVFYPLSGGHPDYPSGWGGFVGLSLAHTRADMARAVMEGIACALRWSLERIEARGVAVEGLVMTGGAARSPLWPQIVADVTALPVSVAGVTEAASWGAAILAGLGAGIFQSIEEAAGALDGHAPAVCLPPNASRRQTYDALFARSKTLSQAIYALR